ncbi:hypothetical protein [Erythrobacter sp. NFXS35]|uniref:hypothetical protein n=1 Tax=Erythrobacter sp. NFXS35 TaxID=2818436 RepID=UPI0032DFF470
MTASAARTTRTASVLLLRSRRNGCLDPHRLTPGLFLFLGQVAFFAQRWEASGDAIGVGTGGSFGQRLDVNEHRWGRRSSETDRIAMIGNAEPFGCARSALEHGFLRISLLRFFAIAGQGAFAIIAGLAANHDFAADSAGIGFVAAFLRLRLIDFAARHRDGQIDAGGRWFCRARLGFGSRRCRGGVILSGQRRGNQ